MSEENIEQQGEYQLVIQNDHLVNNRYAVPIVWNKEALKIGLQNALKKHKDVVYTEDKLPEAKSQRAKLNGLWNTLDTERKRVKNECLEFYQQFESDVKELMALVKEPIKTIDDQLDVYEQRRIDEKYHECVLIYEEIFPKEIAEVICFCEIYNPKWINKGYSLANVRQDLADMCKQITIGIASIKALNSKHELALLKTFYATRDMSAVLRDKGEYEQMEVREQMRQQAIAEQPKPQPVVYAAPEPVTAPKAEPEPLLSVVFRVVTTKAKMDALKAYIKENNIKIERV